MLIDENIEPVFPYTCPTCGRKAIGILNDKWCLKCYDKEEHKKC